VSRPRNAAICELNVPKSRFSAATSMPKMNHGPSAASALCIPDAPREEKAQSRFDLLQYSAGPVLCHDDLQQGNVLAGHGPNGSLQLAG
jgi:hypothetical protein